MAFNFHIPRVRLKWVVLSVVCLLVDTFAEETTTELLRSAQRASSGLMVAECSSSAELVRAILSPACGTALITADLEMSEADWAPYPGTVLLGRNFTILGTHELKEEWPLVDLGYVYGRIQLGPGVYLNFSRIVISRTKAAPPFQTASLDILASSNASSANGTYRPAIVVAWNAAVVWNVCLPSSQSNISGTTWARPVRQIPGVQTVTPRVEQSPNCSNSSAASPMTRCWAAVGSDEDLAVYGTQLDAYGKPVLNGYLVWVYATYFLCEAEMSYACLAQYGPVGCYNYMVALQKETSVTLEPEPLPLPYGGGAAAAGDANGGPAHARLAPLLGGVLGGSFLAAVAVLFVWHRLRLRKRDGGLPSWLKPLAPGALTGTHEGDSDVPDALSGLEAALGAEPPAPLLAGAATCAKGSRPLSEGGRSTARSSSTIVVGQLLRMGTGTLTPEPEPAPVTPLTPAAPDVNLAMRPGTDGSPSPELELLPTCLGTGAAGRVVLGLYQGQRVAVKLLNAGLLTGVEPAAATRGAAAAAAAPPEPGLGAGAAAPPGHKEQGGTERDADAARRGEGAGATQALAGEASGDGAAEQAAEDADAPDDGQRCRPAADPAATPVRRAAEAAEAEAAEEVEPGADVGAAGPAAPKPRGKAAAEEAMAAAASRTFAQEVVVLARCRHPNIVRLLAANLAPPRPCLVMELMDSSLERLLHGTPATERRLLPMHTVLHIASQVAQALAYLHPTVLHRDLKPANVLVSQPDSATPIVKLADFGLSRLRSTALPTQNPEVGTFPYMAPESFDVSNYIITDRADVYAFGVILWEMLAGRRPWEGVSAFQVACAVTVRKSRLSLSRLPPGRCPHKLRALIASCWEHEPARRPAAAEIVKSLALVKEVLDNTGRRPGAQGAAPAPASRAPRAVEIALRAIQRDQQRRELAPQHQS